MKILFLIAAFFYTSFTIGAQTRFVLPCGQYISELSLRIAITQVGVSDAKSPSVVREYLTAAGVRYYNPFCMSGQYWSFKQAQRIINYCNAMFGLSLSNKLPFPRSALANSPFWFAKKYGERTAYKAETGDMLIWYVAQTSSGHIERVTKCLAAGWVYCIAFNTGNREVKITKRNILHPIGRRLIRGLVGFRYDSN